METGLDIPLAECLSLFSLLLFSFFSLAHEQTHPLIRSTLTAKNGRQSESKTEEKKMHL